MLISKENYYRTCDFPGGSGPPIPPSISGMDMVTNMGSLPTALIQVQSRDIDEGSGQISYLLPH